MILWWPADHPGTQQPAPIQYPFCCWPLFNLLSYYKINPNIHTLHSHPSFNHSIGIICDVANICLRLHHCPTIIPAFLANSYLAFCTSTQIANVQMKRGKLAEHPLSFPAAFPHHPHISQWQISHGLDFIHIRFSTISDPTLSPYFNSILCPKAIYLLIIG